MGSSPRHVDRTAHRVIEHLRQPHRYMAQARVHATTALVMVDAAVAHRLLPAGLALRANARDRHPLLIDIRRIRAGVPMVAGKSMHDYVANLWGLFGSASAAFGRTLSERTAQAVGAYDEVIVSVPNTERSPDGPGYNFVKRMWTSSRFVNAAERHGGWGYDKHLAHFEWSDHERRVHVRDQHGQLLLSAEVDHDEDYRSFLGVPGAKRLASLLSAPALGVRQDGAFALSIHDRYGMGGTVAARAAATFEIGNGLAPGLPAGRHAISATASVEHSIALHVKDDERLSYPVEVPPTRPLGWARFH